MFFFWSFPFYIFVPFILFSIIFRVMRHINIRQLEERRTDRSHLPKVLRRGNVSSESSSDDFEVYVYRLAAKYKGRLTPAKIVVDSGLPMKEVEKRMSALVDNLHVRMEVSDEGLIYYDFPELEGQ